MISSIIFFAVLIITILVFYRKVIYIDKNIVLVKNINLRDNRLKRLKLMTRVAIGQSKMTSRPVAALLHIFIYVGFIIVNFEMLEILIDGIFGSHRFFSFLGEYYYVLISIFEGFAFAVMLGCLIFLIRRNIIRLKRFWNKEMTLWPRSDANIILVTEIFLMSALLTMNATDSILQTRPGSHFVNVGSFPISNIIQPLFAGLSDNSLHFIERFCWWFHIVGVFIFLNYIPYSKHFHVFLAFPNVYFSKLEPKGKLANMPSVTKEVKLMLNENASEVDNGEEEEVVQFGAKDIRDFNWKHLMDAYTCTECGRCTSSCPANITGKKLSPRKVIMDLRDRVEFIGKQIKKNSSDYTDDKSLFDYSAG